MSYSSTYALGTIGAAPGESSVVIRPKYPPTTPKPGVMFVHGAGSDSTYCISPLASQAQLTRKVAAAGFHGFSHDNGGVATWGNDTAISRLTAGRTHLQSALPVKAGKVALVAASMGGLNALAWAGANPAQVSCIVAVIPVIDVTDIHANNRSGYAASINSAYAGGWSEATYGATHNPLTMARAGLYAGIPMLLFYGLTDTLCIPAKTEQFAALPGMNVTLAPIPTGHDFATYDAVDHDQAVAFLTQHAT